MTLAHALPSDLKRAWLLFLMVYVGINIPAVALYISVAALMSTPLSPPQTIMDDPAYRTTQQLYPLLNLALWMLASWQYQQRVVANPGSESLRLGLFWLGLAVPLDFLIYVVLPTPLSVSVGDFYVGQFPWIYLTYLAVAISPLCYSLCRPAELTHDDTGNPSAQK